MHHVVVNAHIYLIAFLPSAHNTAITLARGFPCLRDLDESERGGSVCVMVVVVVPPPGRGRGGREHPPDTYTLEDTESYYMRR